MKKCQPERLRLQGFNNLTKTLNCNVYAICYAHKPEHQQEYLAYIHEQYNAERLTQVLTEVAGIIGANILNIARQDYEPQGASVTILLAEEPVLTKEQLTATVRPGLLPDDIVMHLDKSHLTVHTYPESHPDNGISTFRADIDVSTCGRISPLKALNYLIHRLESDIVTVDYRVRGFTRDIKGKKHFIDHKIDSIQDFMTVDIKRRYTMADVNMYRESMFHTKMLRKDFGMKHYLFGLDKSGYTDEKLAIIEQDLRKEMSEIFYGSNVCTV